MIQKICDRVLELCSAFLHMELIIVFDTSSITIIIIIKKYIFSSLHLCNHTQRSSIMMLSSAWANTGIFYSKCIPDWFLLFVLVWNDIFFFHIWFVCLWRVSGFQCSVPGRLPCIQHTMSLRKTPDSGKRLFVFHAFGAYRISADLDVNIITVPLHWSDDGEKKNRTKNNSLKKETSFCCTHFSLHKIRWLTWLALTFKIIFTWFDLTGPRL